MTYQATGIVSIVWAWVTDSGMTRVSGSSPSAFRSTRNHDQNPDYKFRTREYIVCITEFVVSYTYTIRSSDRRSMHGSRDAVVHKAQAHGRHMVAQT